MVQIGGGIIDVDLHIAIIREWHIVGVATGFVKYQGKTYMLNNHLIIKYILSL